VSAHKIPSLINGSTGAPKEAIAGKKCKCKGCDTFISKGERCYDIPNPTKSFSNPRRFCTTCFRSVLEKSKADIAALEASSEALPIEPHNGK
jgi:hypothetical protein